MVTSGQLGRHGRLGNQLFQVASTIGIAKANGYEFAFPEWINHDAKERFGSTEDIEIGKWFPNWKEIRIIDPTHFDEHFVGEMGQLGWGWQGLKHPDGVSYVGHMQTERYFAHCADYIRNLFTFREPAKVNSYTAIHVRCGDYGSDYHPICTRDYYEQAMYAVPGPYIVFSDDAEKAYEILRNLLDGRSWFHTGTTHDALHAMTECRRHIIANSTFSWWGAWLANSSQVVAPRQWFGPAAAHLDTSDIYPPNWTVI